jgi:hypothetical protein
MKPLVRAVSLMILMFVAVAAVGQSSNPKPAPELRQEDVWVGDWTCSGTAKDTPTGPEYKVDWQMHSHWILGGFFLESNSTWKGSGKKLQWLEIGCYDPIKRIHVLSGFGSDGTTWVLTATFDNETSVESGTTTDPNGTLTNFRNTFIFSSDRMAVSGTEESEQNGVRWTSFQVKGTKSKTAH